MLNFLNSLVVRPEGEVAKKYQHTTLEFIAWRHRACDESVSLTVIESTLLVVLELTIIGAFTRLVPVMGGAPARAGGAGLLGFVMFLMVVGFAVAGLRLYQNIQMIRRLNVETFDLEERLGDDEEDE
jgi:hypothetical protein